MTTEGCQAYTFFLNSICQYHWRQNGELDGPWLDKSGHLSSSSGHDGPVQHTSTPAFGVQQWSVVNVYGEGKKQEQKDHFLPVPSQLPMRRG